MPRRRRSVDTVEGQVRLRQLMLVMVVAGLAVFSIAGCSSSTESTPSTTVGTTTTTSEPQSTSEALTGLWERTGGDFSALQGMIVEVIADSDEGVVTFAPRNPYGFKAGDVKWSDFTTVSNDRVRMRDLVRDTDTGLPSYITGVITMTEDWSMMEITFPSSGTIQVWTRIS